MGKSVNPLEFTDVRLPRDVQVRRVNAVMQHELTPLQRDIVVRVMRGEPQAAIAADRGVSRSTVSRTYKRGIARLQRFLRY